MATELNDFRKRDIEDKKINVNQKYTFFEVRHSSCVGSITKNFCVLHIQTNTTIFRTVIIKHFTSARLYLLLHKVICGLHVSTNK